MDDPEDTVTHPSAVALLDYVVGELSPQGSDEVRAHVDVCGDCRERVLALAGAMDELDRLPSVPLSTPSRRTPRVVPIVLLLAAAIGVVALFQIGAWRQAAPAPDGRVVLETANDDPVAVVTTVLGGIPHTVSVDRDDERHLIVLVGPGDAAAAEDRLGATRSADGLTYTVDVAESASVPLP